MGDVTLGKQSSQDKTDTTSGTGDVAGGVSRPKFYRGTDGKVLSMSANYLQMNLESGKGVFEYEVRYDPRTDNRDQRFRLLNQHREVIGGVKVFDGVKLYLPQKLAADIEGKELFFLYAPFVYSYGF